MRKLAERRATIKMLVNIFLDIFFGVIIQQQDGAQDGFNAVAPQVANEFLHINVSVFGIIGEQAFPAYPDGFGAHLGKFLHAEIQDLIGGGKDKKIKNPAAFHDTSPELFRPVEVNQKIIVTDETDQMGVEFII